MNVSLQKYLYAVFLLLLFPLFGEAQQVIELEAFEDQSVTYDFLSLPNDPSVLQQPSNGTIAITEANAFNYVLVYTPNEGYLGPDFIRIAVWNSPVQWEYRDLEITVLAAKVEAKHDYASTALNTPVSIPVLDNDFSSNGVKVLTYIPLTNNGSAVFDADATSITFTPDLDFEGIAQFNYVLCDGAETCDQGSVSVCVLGDMINVTDTIELFTKKNLSQVVLVPSEFTQTEGPDNGYYDFIDGVPSYIPFEDYVGDDYILFENDGVFRRVEISVLDLEDNNFAVDDQVFTTPGNAIEFNVLSNDLYGQNTGCFYVISAPENGTVVDNNFPKGSVTYTPNPGFIGVDKFTYSSGPPLCTGDTEVATVYVFVSNYAPSVTTFEMVTPKRTPLVIGNNVPISNFNYQIQAQGTLGIAAIYNGQQTIPIYGQDVEGYNMIIYTPNDGIDSGEDEIELSYCEMINGECAYEKTLKIKITILDIGDGEPQCFDDCVWAGDTNYDGIVNMEDLLPLGISMGEIGVPRTDVDFSQWYGKYGDDWENPYTEGDINLKHLDTDGDSIVTALDTAAISQFYGNTHSLVSAMIPFYEHEIRLVGDIFVGPGDVVELEMYMGKNGDPAVDIYGFTFPFAYNPAFFKPESVEIEYTDDSWLAYNSPTLTMTRNSWSEVANTGKIESGFTRTSGVAASGLGKIGFVRFIIEDDVEGFRPGQEIQEVTVGGGTATVMNSAGHTSGLTIGEATIQINLAQEEAKDEYEAIHEDLLKVWPNPTRSVVNVHLNGGNDFEQVIIYNTTGQEVYNSGTILTNHKRVNVHRLGTGIYVMNVFTKGTVITKRFEVLK